MRARAAGVCGAAGESQSKLNELGCGRMSAVISTQSDGRGRLAANTELMDWNARRITAVLENALIEDRATRDATSYACIDPNQRAVGTILAKQDCVLAGIGCVARILDVYAMLDGAVTSHYEVTSHPEIFDGVRLHKGQTDCCDSS